MQDGKLIYENKLSCEKDVEGFVLEGSANLSFPEGKLRMENALSAAEGQKADYVLWCPKGCPADVGSEWKVRPMKEAGAAVLPASMLESTRVFLLPPQRLPRR